jgi:hypothetical protein
MLDRSHINYVIAYFNISSVSLRTCESVQFCDTLVSRRREDNTMPKADGDEGSEVNEGIRSFWEYNKVYIESGTKESAQ